MQGQLDPFKCTFIRKILHTSSCRFRLLFHLLTIQKLFAKLFQKSWAGTLQTHQVIWITFSLHATFGKNHPRLELSSHLLICLNNVSNYEKCIVVLELWSLCVFWKSFATTTCKRTEQSSGARVWSKPGEAVSLSWPVCEHQIRDETGNGLWLVCSRPWMWLHRHALQICSPQLTRTLPQHLRLSVVSYGWKCTVKTTFHTTKAYFIGGRSCSWAFFPPSNHWRHNRHVDSYIHFSTKENTAAIVKL